MLFINKTFFLCTLFRLIFIDLQNVGVISAALCITQQNYVTCSYFRWHIFQDSLPSGEVHSKHKLL